MLTSKPRAWIRTIHLAAFAVSLPACSDAFVGAEPVGVTVTVRVVTSGTDIDPDGYTLLIGSCWEGPDTSSCTGQIPVPSDMDWAWDTSADRPLRLELVDVADNCAVQGQNPRVVPIPSDRDETETTLNVLCSSL